jgi:two-component sensor histidine kinase
MDVSIFDAAPDPVAVFDAAGAEVWTNRAWRLAASRSGPLVDSALAWGALHRRGRLRQGDFDVLVSDAGGDRLLVVARDVSEMAAAAAGLRRALDAKSLRLEEVHHRVKNNLQVVSSLLRMQARRLDDAAARAALEECRRRVQVMSGLHEQLTRTSESHGVDLGELGPRLVSDLVTALATPGLMVTVQTAFRDAPVVPLAQAMPLALILHELVANALHHAWPDGGAGRLRVSLGRDQDGATQMCVEDDGCGLPGALSTQSMGLSLIRALAKQCGAVLEDAHAAGALGSAAGAGVGGTRWTLSIPAPLGS